MLGFSFRFWNRAGAIRRRRICGRYGYHTTETILPRRICGRCCYHDGGDGSADAAVTMLFAAVGVEVLGSETTETDLRTLLLPCYLQLLGCRCWGARRRRRICGRCCYHAICSCWGAGAGERDGGDESADAAVTMLFAAVGVEVLGSETTETNLRTLLLPCYLQLLGCRCWGARLPRRICGRWCYYHAICSCWGAGAGERDYRDESADAAVTMLFAAVGVQVLGSETEETNLRTLLLPCYLQLLGWRCWGARRRRRICGRCCCHAICSCWGGGAGERDYRDESADAAVAMLFAAVGVEVLGSETTETNLRTLLLPCYLQLLGCRCWGARRRRRICGRCCYHAICSCWGAGAGERDGGDESADAAVTMLFAAVGVEVLGPRRRGRICGRCCCHAICSCWGGGAGERDYRDESADAAVTMLFAAVGVQVLGSETTETNLRTLLLPCYLQLLGWRCWGARLPRRICGRCCYHAICSCWGAGAGERDGGDESADAAVTMLFAAVGAQVLGSETEETNLRTLLLPCYLQLLGCRCWGARRRRRICGRCCYHAICSCWGAGAGERDGGDESADAAVTMLFAAVGVEVLGSETEETNLRTLLLPCYLQLLGWRCWGARLPRRICGRCCCYAICSCPGGGERDYGDESADAAVTMLFAAVGVQVLGSETEETNLRTLLLPCYLQLLGCRCWGARRRRRICGRCYHAICSCWGGGAGERDGGDESADAAVAMLFAAVGVEVLGSETTETNLRTLLLPCYLQLLRCRYWGARRRRRICGRCCYHAFCSCWGGGAGERDGGDESADAAVPMLFAAAGVEVLGSETTETNLRTLLLPCYLQLLGWRCWGARLPRRICGRCCCHAICSCCGGGAGERDYRDESADAAVAMLFAAVGVQVPGSEMEETNLRTLLLPCYLQLLGCRCWGARRRRRICGRCCSDAICSCWGGAAGERYGGDESADAAVPMLFAAVGVEVLGSETEETNLRTLLLPCNLQLLGCRCWGARRRRRICGRCCYHAICSCWGAGPRRICGRCCYHAICSCWGAGAGERDGGDASADAAVAMLFAAVGVEVLGSETTETNLRTLLLPCYLQLLRCRYWGARRRRRICGRCCYHAICSCWGGGAGERDGGDESADAAVTMLFAAASVELLGSDTEEMHLRTLLFPCYLQLLGWRCWGAIRRGRICGRCCCHAICSCWGGGAGERHYRDESAAVAMLFAAVGVEVLGSETTETNLRTLLLPCYLQLLGWRCWGARLPRRICGRCCCHAICSCWGAGAGERDGGDESADAAVTMLFAAVGVQVLGSETEETNLRTLLFPCYLQLLGWSCWGARRRRRICGRCCYHAICSCWGGGAGERDYRDESADAAVTMLFAARLPRRICGRCCYHAICSCWGAGAGERDGGDESADAAVTMLFAAVGVQLLGSETEETNLRTLLLPCYLQLLGWRCWGARLPRRICGRCCCHAICSCWGGGAGERDYRDKSADAAVTMLFAAVGVQVLGSDTEETNLRTLLLPCYLQLLGCSCWGARLRRWSCGRCCYHANWGLGSEETELRTVVVEDVAV